VRSRAAAALTAALASAACLAAPRDAHAHKLNVFAAVEGDVIAGQVYFTGGGAARDVPVAVLAPDGRSLGATRTDERGNFTFTPAERCDHTFVVEAAGHAARYVVPAAELPAAAPATSQPVGVGVSAEQLRAMVDQAVARRVGELRRQLDRQESRVRLRDVVGGIGYILGLAGVAMLLAARHRRAGRSP